jgi:hypothetical protein
LDADSQALTKLQFAVIFVRLCPYLGQTGYCLGLS